MALLSLVGYEPVMANAAVFTKLNPGSTSEPRAS